MDILTPEFISLTDKIKSLYEKREEKTAEFKAVWLKHKGEIAELEQEAAFLMEGYSLIVKKQEAESPATTPAAEKKSASRKK